MFKKTFASARSIFIFLGSIGLISACVSNGNCREVAAAKQAADTKAGTTPDNSNKDASMTNVSHPQDRVKVFKYDGSLQCKMGTAVSVDDMKKELKTFTVYSSQNKSDGLMHMQVCGKPTGKANVYEVDRKDLAEVKKLGFKEWLWD
jgi:hypothetical protein